MAKAFAMVRGAADTAAATRLLSGYSLTPLSAYQASTRTPSLILATSTTARRCRRRPARASSKSSAGISPPIRRRPATGVPCGPSRGPGIGAGRIPSAALGGLDARARSAAGRAGKAVVHALAEAVRHEPSRVINGWATTPADTARFGRDYVGRTVVAAIGLGANISDRALYLTEDRDSVTRALDGSHASRLHFPAGQLPRVSAFWSLTRYDRRILSTPTRCGATRSATARPVCGATPTVG